MAVVSLSSQEIVVRHGAYSLVGGSSPRTSLKEDEDDSSDDYRTLAKPLPLLDHKDCG
jgi:hypothetical protein